MEWDPIGVTTYSVDLGECDADIPEFYKLLEGGADHQEIFAHLWTIETDTMGLGDRQMTEKFSSRLCRPRIDRKRRMKSEGEVNDKIDRPGCRVHNAEPEPEMGRSSRNSLRNLPRDEIVRSQYCRCRVWQFGPRNT